MMFNLGSVHTAQQTNTCSVSTRVLLLIDSSTLVMYWGRLGCANFKRLKSSRHFERYENNFRYPIGSSNIHDTLKHLSRGKLI